MKINVGASRKVGEPNYGSRGASVHIELDGDVASDPEKIQATIRRLFGFVRASLAEELGNGNGNMHGHANVSAPPPNNHPAGRRPATEKQVKALHAIARQQRIDLFQLVQERFRVSKPEGLSLTDASVLIDELRKERA